MVRVQMDRQRMDKGWIVDNGHVIGRMNQYVIDRMMLVYTLPVTS